MPSEDIFRGPPLLSPDI